MTEQDTAGDVQEELFESQYFSSPVYSLSKPEFLTVVKPIFDEYIKVQKNTATLNEFNPAFQSTNMIDDSRLSEIVQFIQTTGWHILASQGYDMQLYDIVVADLWAQEHYKLSGQDVHMHSRAHLSGLYFLDGPTPMPVVVIHDPRSAKVYSSLAEANIGDITHASTMINFTPSPGLMLLMNSWLPHSIDRNDSKTPFKFLHFNIVVTTKQSTPGTVEIV